MVSHISPHLAWETHGLFLTLSPKKWVPSMYYSFDQFPNTLHDSSLENHTRFQTKMGKIYSRLISEQKGTKTLPDVAAHTYRVARNFCGF